MTLALQIPETHAEPAPDQFRRFTVDEYHRLLEVGILRSGDPIELLEGWLVQKMTRGSGHDLIVNRLHRWLTLRLPSGWMVRGQSAITLEASEPEPDLAVALEPDSRYQNRHPLPPEIALLVEVSDSSAARDKDFKARIYAAASIPQYWIIDLPARVLEVCTDPDSVSAPPIYRSRRTLRPGDNLQVMIEQNEAGILPVADLFPN